MSPLRSKPKPRRASADYAKGLFNGWALAVETLRSHARLAESRGNPLAARDLRAMADLLERNLDTAAGRLAKGGPPTSADIDEEEAS